MTTWIEKRTAFDPDDYVARLIDTYRDHPLFILTAAIVSVDGVTKTGRKRYTIRLTKIDREAA